MPRSSALGLGYKMSKPVAEMTEEEREQKREWNRNYYATHREQFRVYAQKNYKTHKERRNYYQTHREQILAAAHKRHKEHPEKMKESKARQKAKNPQKAYMCDRKSHIKLDYKVTSEVAAQLAIVQQTAVCAICGENRGVGIIHIDHDHVTGELRGYLCGKCNMAFGLMEENAAWLRKMADYKEQPPGVFNETKDTE